MDYKEFNQALANLDQAVCTLEDLYLESEGECTEQTEQTESLISELQALLTTDGADFLGGWLKAKEDRKKALKAEKDYITRQMSAIDESTDFIKGKIYELMAATGTAKLKGTRGYSFATAKSVKTEVNKDILKDLYAEQVEEAVRAAGIPAYIGVTLTASCTKASEVGVFPGDQGIFETVEKDTVRFTKPRASKEA